MIAHRGASWDLPENTLPAFERAIEVGADFVEFDVHAEHDGTWPRLKICSADTCRYVYYDRSKNGSRRWCSMDVCGNRNKTRAYRDRNRAGS